MRVRKDHYMYVHGSYAEDDGCWGMDIQIEREKERGKGSERREGGRKVGGGGIWDEREEGKARREGEEKEEGR